MAESLARIYGTEEDKVNCPFYFKIGACRHGDRCSRQHNRPHFSQTLIIPHFYQPPPVHPQTGQPLVNEKEHLTEFCEEVIDELQNFGLLEEFHIVANLGEHMLGNVYLKYSSEEEAERALKALHGRFYSGRQLTVEFSPVSDFRESRCRQYDEETCNRGAFCNFHHMRPLPSSIRKELERIRSRGHRRRRDRSRSRDRDRSDRDRYRSDRDRDRDRDRERERERGRDGDRDRERERDRDRDRRRDDRDRSSATPSTVEESRSSDRSASEERRAKIAEWNRQRDERNRAPNSSESGHREENSHSTDRSASEERRAKIAEWNKQRDAKKAEETETTTSSQQAPTS